MLNSKSNFQRYNLARCALLRFLSPPRFADAYISDWLIGNATAQSTIIPTSTLTNGTTFSGQTSYGGYVYETSVQYVSGYLSNTSNGINHYLSVGANGTNAVDGLVAMMDVKILTRPASGSSKSSSCVNFHPVPVAVLMICVTCLFCVAERDYTNSPHSSRSSLHSYLCSLLHYSSLNLSGHSPRLPFAWTN